MSIVVLSLLWCGLCLRVWHFRSVAWDSDGTVEVRTRQQSSAAGIVHAQEGRPLRCKVFWRWMVRIIDFTSNLNRCITVSFLWACNDVAKVLVQLGNGNGKDSGG